MKSYILRTSRGAPVYTFDNLARAQQAWAEAEVRLKIPLKLFEVEIIETEIPVTPVTLIKERKSA